MSRMITTEAERVVMEAIRDLEQNLDSLSLKSRRNYHLRRRHFLRQALAAERRRVWEEAKWGVSLVKDEGTRNALNRWIEAKIDRATGHADEGGTR